MRRLMSHPLRLLAIAAVAIPASLATVALAGSTAYAVSVTCTKLSGTVSGGVAHISGCTDTTNDGGAGTAPIAGFASGSGTITWATGHGTTSLTDSFTAVGKSGQPADETESLKCATTSQEYVITGKVTGDTGKATSITVGSAVKAEICLSSAGAFALEPGTKLLL